MDLSLLQPLQHKEAPPKGGPRDPMPNRPHSLTQTTLERNPASQASKNQDRLGVSYATVAMVLGDDIHVPWQWQWSGERRVGGSVVAAASQDVPCRLHLAP